MYQRLSGKSVPKVKVSAILILREFGRSHYLRGDYMLALDYYTQELETYRTSFAEGKSSVDISDTLFNIGSCYRLTEQHKEAEQYLEQAMLEYKK